MINKASDYLDSKHIKHSLMGYDYLTMAIEMGLEDKQLVCRKLTTVIYSAIAQTYSINTPCVERNIRHAIQRSDTKDVTNAEFIARAVDEIKAAKL